MFEDNNLFNPQWTTGSLSAISPIVQVVGFCAMALISIGGFFMVILPLMRNVVNGIVVVAPNLCDKIDEAHRNKLGLRHDGGGGNQIQMVVGSLMMIILSFFPNFKAMSDFEEGIRDPKSFMIKALPMMCIYIFIGVFVFYGYPAKFAEKFSGAATGVIDMALNNVDPVAWIEKLPTKMTKPDLATDNASDTFGKNTNKLSKSIYTALTSNYGAMSKDNRVAMSHKIEEYSQKLIEGTEQGSLDKYSLTVESRVMTYEPTVQKSNPSHDTTNNIYIYQYKDAVTNQFDIGVPGDISSDHFMVILKYYELSEKADKATSVRSTAKFYISATENKLTSDPSSKTVTVKLNGTYFAAPATIGTSGGKDAVKINGYSSKSVKVNSDGSFEVVFSATLDEFKAATTGSTSGLLYIDPKNKSYRHPISSVTWVAGTSKAVFTPENSTSFNGWTLGEGPTVKKASNTETDSKGRASDDK